MILAVSCGYIAFCWARVVVIVLICIYVSALPVFATLVTALNLSLKSQVITSELKFVALRVLYAQNPAPVSIAYVKVKFPVFVPVITGATFQSPVCPFTK